MRGSIKRIGRRERPLLSAATAAAAAAVHQIQTKALCTPAARRSNMWNAFRVEEQLENLQSYRHADRRRQTDRRTDTDRRRHNAITAGVGNIEATGEL